jgi:outer membrane protein TolC
MLKLLILFYLSSIVIPFTFASSLKISESFLIESAKNNVPTLEEIEAQFLSNKTKAQELNEEFSPEIFAKGSRSETNERALITFQPVFTPVTQTQIGVKQNLKYGASASLAFYTDERDSSSSPVAGNFRHATTMGVNFSMQIDLWKNLFGRLAQARLELAELDNKKAELQKDIQKKNFIIGLRKVFWALVANEESLKISEELLKTAKRQAEEAKRRFKNSIADADEVARYEAQVSSRQSNILYLNYQRETLITQLRNFLPEALGTSDVVVDGFDFNQTVNEVLSCTSLISKETAVPYKNTKYDEVVEILRKMKVETRVLTDRYSDLDVKLLGGLKATGVSSQASGPGQFRGSYGGAFDDINQTNRTGYEIGLQVSLPLDHSKHETKKTKEIYDEKVFFASISKTESQVINTHKELIIAINYLNEVIKNQKLTSIQLSKRLEGMKRKYQQARVSVNELILDQDALLSSELSIIQTQLQVINIIFDYFAIFTETPCGFNRI